MNFFAINVVIILENSHRFKDDPEYGEIMMRIWKGEFTEEDWKEQC
jgi:predicted double-glycine peptidase